MAKKQEKKQTVEVPKPPKARGVVAMTDGSIIQITQITCTPIELQAIGQKMIQVANQLSQQAVESMRQAEIPAKEVERTPPKPLKVADEKPSC